MKSRLWGTAALGVAVVLTASACSAGSGGGGGDSAATGPITIWYSNNEQEIKWGEQVVEAWNEEHPDEEVTAQEIPAGKSSEEVIGAAIAAGNAPCLVYNVAPAAVADFQRQGGLVDLSGLPGGTEYIEERSGDDAAQFTSSDGHYYQMPWKSNPVVLFYNKAAFEAAGLDAEQPALSTYDDFLDSARALVSSGAAKYAVYPSPGSEFYQPWFDFYPFFAAESGGSQLLEDGTAAFTDDAGLAVADFWSSFYEEGLAGKEVYTGDAFTDGVSAMAIAGPWAVASYEGKVDWGTVSVPTSAGTDPADTYTFDDAKNIGMFTSCENQGTAWEFLKFSTSEEQDGALLELTGQMPLRPSLATVYPDFFAEHPEYEQWAEGRTVAVPNTLNSTEIWQVFRDAWTKSVIFGEQDVQAAFDEAAAEIDTLASAD
ncbi:extracellular solute-binding protein [Agromyces sp. NPDC049794]|uniref:extracellular solute-binding protein n=1 Tax=unclassified Agromyces TaxID=2639701 RepID=UPI0033EC717C